MAFDRAGLYCLNAAAPPGSRVWSYQTLDALATLRVVGYFNAARRELALGDKLEVTVVGGSIKAPTSITARATTYVNQNDANGVVDVVDPVSHASTDTD